ncbi:MAG: amidase [Chloroflexota bacterium]|nr:amidase [Chloroflexota bacterium]
MTPITIAEAARQFRAGDTTAVALTEALLDRVAATEPAIHAFVSVLSESALTAAAHADIAFRAGSDHDPLQGIPLGVKDIFDMAGMLTGCGSPTRAECPLATVDAPAVAALRQAGAVFIGKTVTQEYAAGVISVPARNPWDPSRIPGGSSGGSAAAIAAGSCLGALGSDTGGSIRIPASLCGIVGLKPTWGRISLAGVFPLSPSLDTAGPLARTVEDVALLYDALTAHKRPAPIAPGVADSPATLAGTRIGVARSFFFDRLQPDVLSAVEAALDTFHQLGAELIETPWPEATAARAAAFLISRVESVVVHDQALRHAPEGFNPDLRLRLEAGTLLSAETYLQAKRARIAATRALANLFREHRLDALAVPTLPATAAPADHLFVAYPDGGEESVTLAYTRLTMPFNATGQPVLSLPCGFDSAGLPIGLQLAGYPDEETALCRIGQAYQLATTWHTRLPKGYVECNPGRTPN